MGFARIYLRVVGAMTVFFGLVYLFAPERMTDPTGFGPLGTNALTDVRATYGGFQIGSGLFLLWAAAEVGRVRLALVLLALTIGAVGSSRLIGFLVDGDPNGVLLAALATEIALTAITVVVLRRLPKTSVAESRA
jgi:hypothetical protein